MPEMKSLTLNDKTYDCFVDSVARSQLETYALIDSASGEQITLPYASNYKMTELHIYGKTTQDGTPTPEAPVELVSVGDSGGIGVTVSGKNLVNAIVNGTHSAAYAGALYCKLDCLEPNTEYTVSFVGADGNKIYANENLFEFKEFLCDGNLQYVTLKTQHNISKDRTDQYTEDRWIIFKNYASNTVVPNFKDVQIERGPTPTTYEPHKAQTCSVSTPNGLPGIPVTSGGNYTDANGQQWVCDEINLARGVYVQRVDKIMYDGSADEVWTLYSTDNHCFYIDNTKAAYGVYLSLCTHFKNITNSWSVTYEGTYGIYSDHSTMQRKYFRAPDESVTTLEHWKAWLSANPITMVYVMANPIETPLSEEELAAYAALHTYRDNTTVFNDAGAYMELEYVMDAKKYIDGLITGSILPATVE